MKPFKEMIKNELEEAVAKFEIAGKVKEFAKVANKPTNAEYVTVLERHAAELEAKKAKEVEDVEVVKEEVVEDGEALSIEEKRANMAADLETCIPVIVTDHDNTVTITEDENRRTVPITWGNPIIGMTTNYVAMHGEVQYLPKGCVARLRRITLADHIKDGAGNETSKNNRARFSVADTTGWTEEEFEAKAAAQRLKRA